MEVTPQVIVNPATGEQTISYDHAVVTDNGYRDDVQRAHRELEKHAYYESDDGIHNVWADQLNANPDLASEEIVEEQQQEEEIDNNFAVFEQGIYDQIGGREAYQQMTAWAAKNWLQSDIDDFDATFDSGDYQEMLNAINFLYNDYHKFK